jgi:hypothetical protein
MTVAPQRDMAAVEGPVATLCIDELMRGEALVVRIQ